MEALQGGELSVNQLIGIIQMNGNNVEVLLHKMVRAGEVVRGQARGRYKLPQSPITPPKIVKTLRHPFLPSYSS